MTDTPQQNTPSTPPSAPPPPPPHAPAAQGGAPAVAAAPQSSSGKRLGGYLLESVLVLVTLGIGWIIWSLIVWANGQTPAKSLLGMRCVRTDTGRVATWGTMALRELVGKWIFGSITFGITTLVSCFMILDQSRQGVWDKVAQTVVVDDPGGHRR